MKIARLLLPLVLLAAPLHAAEKAPAEVLLDTMNFNTTSLAAAKAAFAPAIAQFQQQGIPAAGIAEINKAADDFFAKTFNDPGLVAAIVKLYEAKFTKTEIEDLIKFYKTPLGRKSLDAIPSITAEAGQIGQEYAQKNSEQFQKDVMAIMAKYQKAAPAGAPEDKQ